jgi:hypothetical protein
MLVGGFPGFRSATEHSSTCHCVHCLHNLLNVLVQFANKMGLQKNYAFANYYEMSSLSLA